MKHQWRTDTIHPRCKRCGLTYRRETALRYRYEADMVLLGHIGKVTRYRLQRGDTVLRGLTWSEVQTWIHTHPCMEVEP